MNLPYYSNGRLGGPTNSREPTPVRIEFEPYPYGL